MYALTNEEVDKVLDTFVLHAHSGTLLILDLNNAAGYLGGGTFKEQTEFAVDGTHFSGSLIAMHEFDRRRQLLVRRRTWSIPGSPPIEDFCEYRLFFPAELEHLLNTKGFRVLGMVRQQGFARDRPVRPKAVCCRHKKIGDVVELPEQTFPVAATECGHCEH